MFPIIALAAKRASYQEANDKAVMDVGALMDTGFSGFDGSEILP